MFYPETTPFAVVAYLAFHAVALVRRRIALSATIALTAYTLLGVILLLRHNLISYTTTLVMQLTSAMHSANLLLSLFPYFLLPTGFSNFFGWMPIAKDFPEPVVSLSIAVGMVLAVAVVWRAVRESWQVSAAAILLLVQIGVAVKLYFAASDFTLYKLAMWTQPALAIGLAGLALRPFGQLRAPSWSRDFRFAPVLVALFALTTAPTALHYSRTSQGMSSGGMTELRFASRAGMAIPPPADPAAQITATIENVVAAKFAGAELRGRQLAFASRDYFFPATRVDYVHPTRLVRFQPHFDDMAKALPLIVERNDQWWKSAMLWRTQFASPVLTRPTDYYLSLADQLSLFNKFGRDPAAIVRQIFVLTPAAAAHNQLVFVHSGLGNHYYLGDRNRISFFQQEPDLFAPGRDFNGLGRFMLLRVEHPTGKIYLRVAATRTLLTGRTAWRVSEKTPPVVHATEDRPLGVVGNGAFNLFIGPLTPQKFEDASYVAIDFADIPHVIMDYRPGLKTLFNREVPLDYRRLLGWARDVSALSEEEFSKLHRPRAVEKFPADLATATTLEFSGAYEDGWLSPDSRFVLDAAQPGEFVHLRGAVPEIPGTHLGDGTVRVTVNGEQTSEFAAICGQFDWLLPVARPAATTKVELHFSITAPLPGRDQRPTGAKLDYLGLAAPAPLGTWDFTQTSAPRLAAPGVDPDGWMTRTATITLPPSNLARELALKIEFPGWASPQPVDLRAQLDDITTASQALAPGAYTTVHLHVPASAAPRTLHLAAAADFPLPSPDLRRRACRLLEVALTAAP